jgi:4'-phosphopantetheinyl transferase
MAARPENRIDRSENTMCTRYQPLCLPSAPVLAPSELHVWIVDLRSALESLPDLRQTLSPDEELRAQRFRSREDGERFIVSRGVLRTLLANYTHQRPERLAFTYGPNGKPALQPASTGDDVRFNLSHSGDYALVAIAGGREIGVDVERVAQKQEIDAEKIAWRFFSPVELASFLEYHPSDRREAFFRFWIRKEAYLKARGFGITRHQEGFEAPLVDGNPSTFAHADGTTWSAVEASPAPGYAAAIVAEGANWQLRSFPFPQSS